MPGVLPILGAPVQLAYHVPDAEAAAHTWAERFGAGPFFLNRHIPVHSVTVRGNPGRFDHTSAYGQWGEVMVELVQQHGDDPSPMRERFAADESGLHHVAYFIDDLDATSAALDGIGMPLAMDAMAGDTRFLFHDAVKTLGHYLELYRPTERLLDFYGMVRNAAQGWDGTNPVRVVGG
jgi:hypothetical protein